MTPLLRGLDLAVLRVASLLVPGCQREEWRDEWCAELWQSVVGDPVCGWRVSARGLALNAFKPVSAALRVLFGYRVPVEVRLILTGD